MEIKEGPLKHVRPNKVQYEERNIDQRARALGGAGCAWVLAPPAP